MSELEKDETKVKAALARAESLSEEERSEIGSLGAQARWHGPEIPKATHEGIMLIGKVEIPCAVLEDGTRLITQSGFMKALGRARQAKGRQYYDGDVNMPAFLTAKNLKPFISEDLQVTSSQVVFRTLRGKKAYGYSANLLPKVCDVFLDAEEADALVPAQFHIAVVAKMIIRGLAHVGIIALVDEATGYQEVRDRQALQAILDKYLTDKFAAWAKRFPDDFYKEIFRLRGWTWKGIKVNKPQVVANYTNDFVYERLAPGLLAELESRNPLDSGKRKRKHHQWLSEDVGHPELAKHLFGVITLMKAAKSWDDFKMMLDQSLPKLNSTPMLNFTEAKP